MYEQIARNRRASWLLMGLVVCILAVLGFAIGYAFVGSTYGGVGLLGVFGIAVVALMIWLPGGLLSINERLRIGKGVK